MSELLVTNTVNPLKSSEVSFKQRSEQLVVEDKKKALKEKEERNSPYIRWTQFNLAHTKEMMWLSLKYPKAQAILYFLVDQMDQYNAVMISYRVIKELLGISQVTVARSIKTLKDKGFITILKSGTNNVYAINDSVYWKSWSNNKKYSRFPANVVISLDEQDIEYQGQQMSLFSAEAEWNKTKEVSGIKIKPPKKKIQKEG